MSLHQRDGAGPPARSARGRPGGIGRASSAEAEAVSDDLRRGTGELLDRRRRVAALSLGSIGALGAVAAYQTGVVRHLPEPPLPGVDADTVDASGEAYQELKTPDAALGILSSAVTLVLAGMGDRRRATERPWLALALAGKVGLDAASGLFLTAEQASKHRRFCSWCLAAAAASVAMVPQVLPEAQVAWRTLRRGGA
ncbi:MAG: vitamin K epoxide reductase [Actinobacteria bacterium]|nr:vitamin K epoxide reductase [Actinomycetota bacterium]MBW3643413.1 vitamin K epoxide reductase [Actinomycetota bacterium]